VNTLSETKPLDLLRQRRGPVPPALREQVKRHRSLRKALTEALRECARTVPELSRATGLAPDEVFWHVMALRKAGRVADGEREGDYIRYVLVEKGPR